MPSSAEALTLDLLIELIIKEGKGADYLAQIAVAYYKAGSVGVVELAEVLSVSFGSADAGQAALVAGCDMCPNASDNRFQRGNADCDLIVNQSDSIFILTFLFLGGPAPKRFDAADADDSGVVDISDPIYLQGWLFLGGPKPPKPYEYLGLDPTQDALETACDLVASRYREFNCYSGDRDVDGEEGADAVWVFQDITETTPLYEIRFEKPTDPPELQRLPYFQFGALPDWPKLLAVGEDPVGGKPVVYVMCNTRKVFALQDLNGDSVADPPFKTIQLPSMDGGATLSFPIDAVLADSENGQCLITLHSVTPSSLERLVVSVDSADADGLIDAPGLPFGSGVIRTPTSLAVDSGTARVFISGTRAIDTTKTAVFYYEDTNGDKLVTVPSAAPYITAPTSQENYRSVVFVPDSRGLLTLSRIPGIGGLRRILCDIDVGDLYTAPTPPQTIFKTGLPLTANFIDAFRLASGGLRVQITHGTYQVYEHDDIDLDCDADIDRGFFDKADAALAEAGDRNGDSVCRVQVYQNFDYSISQCMDWDNCNTNGSTQFSRTLMASVSYPCVALPPQSIATGGWAGGTPANLTMKAEWDPPVTDVAQILVDGETCWNYSKAATCCLYHCTVLAELTVETIVYLAGATLPGEESCPGLQQVVFVHRFPACPATDVDCRPIMTSCPVVELPSEFYFGVQNNVTVDRTGDVVACTTGNVEAESVNLKTYVRIRCRQ